MSMRNEKECKHEELKRYVKFEKSDEKILETFKEFVEPYYGRVVDAFYQRILEHKAARSVFQNEFQMKRLRVTLGRWLGELFEGPWERTYYEQRFLIGKMHVQVKLPQRYMTLGMSVIRRELYQIVDELGDKNEALRKLKSQAKNSISKILDIDLCIMLDSYRADSLETVRRFEAIEKEELRDALVESEAKYRWLFESASLLVVAFDEENRMRLFNQKAAEIGGVFREEGIGRNFIDVLVHARSRKKISETIDRIRDNKEVGSVVAKIDDGYGGKRELRWHMSVLKTSPGKKWIGAIGEDISEQQYWEHRAKTAEHLASLGVFSAGLAHEIRNPLNAAQLQLTVAERRFENREIARGNVGLIAVRSELERLARLVDDFLQFARPAALRLTPCDIRSTIEDVVDFLQPALGEKEIVCMIDGIENTIIQQDKERIKQVLINLLKNSVDVSRRGDVINVRTERRKKSVLITVSDSGPGIAKGVDVFEAFATTKAKGTGLRLPIAARIVHEHGGEITVSREKERTVFTIKLPIDGPNSGSPLEEPYTPFAE